MISFILLTDILFELKFSGDWYWIDFYLGQFGLKFCLQLLSWTGHWKDPSQEFIPYKIITVTNYKNFYTAQRKKLVNKAEILLLIEIITGTFQYKSVLSFQINLSLSHVLLCSFQGHLKLGEKFCAKRGPPSNFEHEPNNFTFLFNFVFFCWFFNASCLTNYFALSRQSHHLSQ
jgi:hypothetical protein